MYTKITELEELWKLLKSEVEGVKELERIEFCIIEKLITAVSVIDLTKHEIYVHAGYVHQLTEKLLNLRDESIDDKKIHNLCKLWLNLLRIRNQFPLKIMHHQMLDGECDFKFSLKLMEGKPCGLKEIQVLNREDKDAIDNAVQSMYRLGCLAHGLSFAGLPYVENTVLTSLMESNDVTCLVAKDQSDQIIGYCWGVMLRDVAVSCGKKANIFWVMDLARDPDFHDVNNKFGDLIRLEMMDVLKARKNCDFVGYQHIVNHKYHTNIVEDEQNDSERVHLKDENFQARTGYKYDEDLGMFMRAHFIKGNDKDLPYPDYSKIRPAIYKAFWHAAHTAKEFFLGAYGFFRVQSRQKSSHLMLDRPLDERLITPVSKEQQACDKDILRQIILSDYWQRLGKGLLGTHVPGTIEKMQNSVPSNDYDFESLKRLLESSGKKITRDPLTSHLYRAISTADSPTFVVNELLKSEKTPTAWIKLIGDRRKKIATPQGIGLRAQATHV
ncbi:MAG TPA: hypothetical protein VL360_05640 [Gammaproteobacteria bacterium]|nr:hypothetical protein [Gammaproteobacteria bacterium]